MAKKEHLYDFIDYKEYLRSRAASERGLKSALAKAMNCQSAYISQVLNEHSHLSLEQADLANQFFSHSDKESQYFLLLVQLERAGTQSLRKFFAQQIESFKEEQLSYFKRHQIPDTLSVTDQAVYYSSWEYNVIHMASTIPELRTKQALQKAFKIPDSKIHRYLDFLLEKGLLKQKGQEFFPGTTENYLDRNSPFVRQLHMNSRALAQQSLDKDRLEDAHYSLVMTLSHKDVIKLKKRINEYIGEIIEMAKESKEEKIYGFTLDFFDIEK